MTYCDIRSLWSIGDCLELLCQSPNLVECNFWHSVVMYLTRPSRSFNMNIFAYYLFIYLLNDSIGPLFDNLTLSVLETFSANCSKSASWAQPQFLSLLSRSACPLLRLHLDFSFEFIDDDLMDCVQLFYLSLTELELRGQCTRTALTRSFFVRHTRYMSENGRNGCLLPNLLSPPDSTSIPGRSAEASRQHD